MRSTASTHSPAAATAAATAVGEPLVRPTKWMRTSPGPTGRHPPVELQLSAPQGGLFTPAAKRALQGGWETPDGGWDTRVKCIHASIIALARGHTRLAVVGEDALRRGHEVGLSLGLHVAKGKLGDTLHGCYVLCSSHHVLRRVIALRRDSRDDAARRTAVEAHSTVDALGRQGHVSGSAMRWLSSSGVMLTSVPAIMKERRG